jgi:hypothetical protein
MAHNKSAAIMAAYKTKNLALIISTAICAALLVAAIILAAVGAGLNWTAAKAVLNGDGLYLKSDVDNATDSGYTDGYSDGLTNGYNKGVTDGTTDGYADGYADGAIAVGDYFRLGDVPAMIYADTTLTLDWTAYDWDNADVVSTDSHGFELARTIVLLAQYDLADYVSTADIPSPIMYAARTYNGIDYNYALYVASRAICINNDWVEDLSGAGDYAIWSSLADVQAIKYIAHQDIWAQYISAHQIMPTPPAPEYAPTALAVGDSAASIYINTALTLDMLAATFVDYSAGLQFGNYMTLSILPLDEIGYAGGYMILSMGGNAPVVYYSTHAIDIDGDKPADSIHATVGWQNVGEDGLLLMSADFDGATVQALDYRCPADAFNAIFSSTPFGAYDPA